MKGPSFSENIRKLLFSIIRTTDYSKGFMRSLALRIIEVWLYGTNMGQMTCNNPKLDLVNMNAYIKLGENLSICSTTRYRVETKYDAQTKLWWRDRQMEWQTTQILYSPPFSKRGYKKFYAIMCILSLNVKNKQLNIDIYIQHLEEWLVRSLVRRQH